jgi:TolB-like protein/DNA-binding winged helix-turn-helix (wHTH) protein/Flp pilus assembly protein TadD
MEQPVPSQGLVRFGPFEADLRTGELRKKGHRVRLPPQPAQVLALLLLRPNDLITRQEIIAHLWPNGIVVDYEHSLNKAVKKLREMLGDDSEKPRYIETLPKRGYRFIHAIDATDGAALRTSARPDRVRRPRSRLWLAVSLALATLSVAVGGYFARKTSPTRHPPAYAKLAVLPFVNLSRDPDQEFFSDALTEEMISQIGRLQPEHLGVIARTTAMQYKATKKTAREVGTELGVDYILESSVQRSGDRVRITAQLISVRDETQLWSESYDRELRDILFVRRQIAEAIASEVGIKVIPQEPMRESARPVNPEAYEAYLKGRHYLNSWTPEGGAKAIDYLNYALERDPHYSLAYAALAEAYIFKHSFSPTDRRLQKAKEVALKAVALDNTLAEAQVSLGLVRLFDWDWSSAETHLKRAVELNPNSAVARNSYAIYLAHMRRFEEASTQTRRAHGVDPLSPLQLDTEGSLLNYLGQYDQALAVWQNAVELSPKSSGAYYAQGLTYLYKGMHEEAFKAARIAESFAAGDARSLAGVGYVYGRAGRRDEALRLLNELRELSKQKSIPASYLAVVYAGLGEKDEAFARLEEAYRQRESALIGLRIYPVFDPLRNDSRFKDLLRRMNFPPDPGVRETLDAAP